jgi:hypothetical protein
MSLSEKWAGEVNRQQSDKDSEWQCLGASHDSAQAHAPNCDVMMRSTHRSQPIAEAESRRGALLAD